MIKETLFSWLVLGIISILMIILVIGVISDIRHMIRSMNDESILVYTLLSCFDIAIVTNVFTKLCALGWHLGVC